MAVALFVVLGCAAGASATFAAEDKDADWPQWRHDAGRSGITSHELADTLHLQWVLPLPPPRPAWPSEQAKLQFDASYEPVAAGGRLFVPSMVHDCVTAYDLASGAEAWRFHADGPVRLAPAVSEGRVYFVSDDGYLYCLRAADGALVWKFRGGPSDRKLLGNDRLISMWPARGGPVVAEGKVYFAAGIWPFMGIFVHALDAETGRVVWTNSGSGSDYLVQPHGSPAFAGVAPQGYLVLSGDCLLVAGGRTVPAAYDRRTGEFRYFLPGSRAFGKDSGGYDVFAARDWFTTRGGIYRLKDGGPLVKGGPTLVGSERCWLLERSRLVSVGSRLETREKKTVDRLGIESTTREETLPVIAKYPTPAEVRQLHLQAGKRLYASDGNARIVALEPPAEDGDAARVVWQGEVKGHVWSLLAASERLVAVTREGWIFCYGSEPRPSVVVPELKLTAASGRLVEADASWRTLNDGSVPTETWTRASFDDGKWKSGPTDLAGADDEPSILPKLTLAMPKKFVTTYFRREFTCDAEQQAARLRLKIKTEHGFVVYLNGVEVARHGLPEGAVKAATLALATANEKSAHDIPLDARKLNTGANQFAVEVHRASASGGAVSFQIELVAKPMESEPRPADRNQKPDSAMHELLQAAKFDDGYALVLGIEEPAQLVELARHSRGHFVLLETDGEKVAAARRLLAEKELLGTRVALQTGDLHAVSLPPYFAAAAFLPDAAQADALDAAGLRAVFESLRPYGGTAVFPADDARQVRIEKLIREAGLKNAELTREGNWLRLVRVGSLPGAADWTHHTCDAGNTLVSRDDLVKAPLGLLWFGGPSHEGILPRHGHGPTPAVIGGRLFIEGPDLLRATDVYTGRLLWERELPGLGKYYDNTKHQPGASAIGGNYVATDDAIYVAYGRQCLRLDPASGETVSQLVLPPDTSGERPVWSYLAVVGDVLVAGSSPTYAFSSSKFQSKTTPFAEYSEGCQRLVAFDRQTGEVLWKRDAEHQFRHNAIAVGGDKVYCIDRLSRLQVEYFKRRGELSDAKPRLLALDLKTGKIAWQTDDQVFGTWLGYSNDHDLLLQAGSAYSDRAKDETGEGMAVFKAATGELVWEDDHTYGGPCLLAGERIITQGTAYNLFTGKRESRVDPLTGGMADWKFSRNYGCNSAIGCTHLLTFRSAAAGFFDLAGDGGTGNFGGFRSSCTSNLVPADGVLSAPDYTRTCTCSYQIQTSLALVHMPEVELWTFNTHSWNGDRVKKIGLNFGAPGDRRAADGMLWIDVPSVGGSSPKLPVEIVGVTPPRTGDEAESGDKKKEKEKPKELPVPGAGPLPEPPPGTPRPTVSYYRQHASCVTEGPLPWVAASGVRGARRILIPLSKSETSTARYTVRLHFAALAPREPILGPAATSKVESHREQSPVMDISLQGEVVLHDYNVAAAADGYNRGVVSEHRGVQVGSHLVIDLAPSKGHESIETELAGVEIVLEEK